MQPINQWTTKVNTGQQLASTAEEMIFTHGQKRFSRAVSKTDTTPSIIKRDGNFIKNLPAAKNEFSEVVLHQSSVN